MSVLFLSTLQVVKHIGALQRLPEVAESSLVPGSKEEQFYVQEREVWKASGLSMILDGLVEHVYTHTVCECCKTTGYAH